MPVHVSFCYDNYCSVCIYCILLNLTFVLCASFVYHVTVFCFSSLHKLLNSIFNLWTSTLSYQNLLCVSFVHYKPSNETWISFLMIFNCLQNCMCLHGGVLYRNKCFIKFHFCLILSSNYILTILIVPKQTHKLTMSRDSEYK